jgi:SAM-dependent methyltransferase
MTSETTDLLAHYLARGREPWNVSLEASWLDYELRAWVRPRLPSGWPVRACNIGIGVGLWDDWLGHELGIAITSIDTDPEVCRTFAMRQRREGHPFPARVRCGNPCGTLGRAHYDVVTIVGSTLAETDDRAGVERAAIAALAPGGVLLVADVGNREPPSNSVELRRLGEMWIAFREVRG